MSFFYKYTEYSGYVSYPPFVMRQNIAKIVQISLSDFLMLKCLLLNISYKRCLSTMVEKEVAYIAIFLRKYWTY